MPFVDLGSDFELNDARAGNAFVCATNSAGNVKCWGRNDSGHLGLGISTDENVGDEPDEMGDNLPYLDLGTTCTAATTAMASGCGGHHSAIVCDNLDVKTWGRNYYGQLGNGDDSVLYIGDDSSDMGDNLDPIENDRAPTGLPTVDPTSSPTTSPTSDPTLDPTMNPTVSPTAAPTTIDHYQLCSNVRTTCQVWENEVKCWGDKSWSDPSYNGTNGGSVYTPQIGGYDLGDADGDFNASYVRCGKTFTCAVSTEGKARCWGMFVFMYSTVGCHVDCLLLNCKVFDFLLVNMTSLCGLTAKIDR